MKNQNKLITEILIIFLSIFFALYAWKHISLPYEKVDIYGEYANKSYNSLNDFVRYAFFILFPVLLLFALKFFNNKNSLNNFIQNISAQNENIKQHFSLRVALIAILIFSCAEFFSINLNQFNLDVYHDGQKITSAYKSFLDSSLCFLGVLDFLDIEVVPSCLVCCRPFLLSPLIQAVSWLPRRSPYGAST